MKFIIEVWDKKGLMIFIQAGGGGGEASNPIF